VDGTPQAKKNLLDEFISAGLCDITKENEHMSIIGNNDTRNHGLATSLATSNEKLNADIFDLYKESDLGLNDEQIVESHRFLLDHIDDVSVQMTLGLRSIKQYKNLYSIKGRYDINTRCRGDAEKMSNQKFERIKSIIGTHEQYLRDNMCKKLDTKRNVYMLELVAFLVPLFAGLKRRMKIPDINSLLPVMSGEDVRTERELPPLMLGAEFVSKRFLLNETSSSKYFNLHGGIQFELETCSIKQDCNE
jgi:hypothetical protein